jgi:hypothetical protein
MSGEHVEHVKYGVTHAKHNTKIFEKGEWGEKLTGTNTVYTGIRLYVCLFVERVHDPLDPAGKMLCMYVYMEYMVCIF